MTHVVCPYCRQAAALTRGSEIYPHRPDLRDTPFYRCGACDAQVGCHPGTRDPLGTLANRELRQARRAAHAAFDPLWREQRMSRTKAYAWLAAALGRPAASCHIGMLDVAACQLVVQVCSARPLEA